MISPLNWINLRPAGQLWPVYPRDLDQPVRLRLQVRELNHQDQADHRISHTQTSRGGPGGFSINWKPGNIMVVVLKV